MNYNNLKDTICPIRMPINKTDTRQLQEIMQYYLVLSLCQLLLLHDNRAIY